MERAQDDIELRLLDGKSLVAANDPVIHGTKPASGWDPFEIWRTRVRATESLPPMDEKDIIG